MICSNVHVPTFSGSTLLARELSNLTPLALHLGREMGYDAMEVW